MWAQNEISTLQMRLREANEELERLNTNPESNTIEGTPFARNGDSIKYLKQDQRITFLLPGGDIQVQVKGDYIEVYASDGNLYIRPHVSNVIQLHLK